MDLTSANTHFLHSHTPVLSGLSTLAELSADDNPAASIRDTRRFARSLTLYALAHLGAYRPEDFDRPMRALLDALSDRLHVPNLYLLLRIVVDGTHARHSLDARGARELCVINQQLAVFFQRVFARQPDFASTRYHHPDSDAVPESQQRVLQRTTDAMYNHLAAKLATVVERARGRGPNHMSALADAARRADIYVHVTESMIRRAIEQQLRAAGWTVAASPSDSDQPIQPRADADLAIASWPLGDDTADYALFCGTTCVGVAVCRRSHQDPDAALAHGRRIQGDVPLLFATDGHPYRSDHPGSGLWFWNARTPNLRARNIDAFYTPSGVRTLLKEQSDSAHSLVVGALRPYQQRAIAACLDALDPRAREPRRSCLVAMAPGTGKTRTAVGLIARLLDAHHVRRVLYLVADQPLAEQVRTRLDALGTHRAKDGSWPVDIATAADMHTRVLTNDDPGTVPSVDRYDGIVVDECPTLDRRVLEHFDAICVGLATTPTPRITELFGEPVFHFCYRDAIIAGALVDHAPPVLIRADQVAAHSPGHLSVPTQPQTPSRAAAPGPKEALHQLPDRVAPRDPRRHRALEHTVTGYSFNRSACTTLATSLVLGGPGKTLIFCVDHRHADMVVGLLGDALQARYGEAATREVVAITEVTDEPRRLLERWQRTHRPTIAVTDDFLTAGHDLPRVDTLVFLRPETSRSLYAQMLGRATRPCPDFDKRIVRIFDCVDGYESLIDGADMRPVLPWPRPTFGQLVEALADAEDSAAQPILEQLIALMQSRLTAVESTGDRELYAELTRLTGASDPRAAIAGLLDADRDGALGWLRAHRSVIDALEHRRPGQKSLGPGPDNNAVTHQRTTYDDDGRDARAYLVHVGEKLTDQRDAIPALALVQRAPHDITRSQLDDIRTALAALGITEKRLQQAHSERTGAPVNVSLLGLLRHHLMHELLVENRARVARALNKMLSTHRFNPIQKQAIERMAEQLQETLILEPSDLDQGAFKTQYGGFRGLNQKRFGGDLAALLDDFERALWE